MKHARMRFVIVVMSHFEEEGTWYFTNFGLVVVMSVDMSVRSPTLWNWQLKRWRVFITNILCLIFFYFFVAWYFWLYCTNSKIFYTLLFLCNFAVCLACMYVLKLYSRWMSCMVLVVLNLTLHVWITYFLSYPPVDDRTDPWNTAMNAACVSHITWQLYYIGHVTSIVFHCFQDRPYHLAQLRHCDVMISPPIRTALPIDVAFSKIYLSII